MNVILSICLLATAAYASTVTGTTENTIVSDNSAVETVAISDNAAGETAAISDNAAGETAAISDNAAGETVAISDNAAGETVAISDNAAGETVAISDNAAGETVAISDNAAGETVAISDNAAGETVAISDNAAGETAAISDGSSAAEVSSPQEEAPKSRGRAFGQKKKCFFACMRGRLPLPPNCNCDEINTSCETTTCGEGQKCMMMFQIFPLCVTDDAVCDLPKATIACDVVEPGFYYNSITGQCEAYAANECADNLNVFVGKGECYKTCKVLKRIMGRGFGRGFRKGGPRGFPFQ